MARHYGQVFMLGDGLKEEVRDAVMSIVHIYSIGIVKAHCRDHNVIFDGTSASLPYMEVNSNAPSYLVHFPAGKGVESHTCFILIELTPDSVGFDDLFRKIESSCGRLYDYGNLVRPFTMLLDGLPDVPKGISGRVYVAKTPIDVEREWENAWQSAFKAPKMVANA